jgi:hypothetical protein
MPDSKGHVPFTSLFKKSPSYDHFRVFGCKVTYLVPKQVRLKSDTPGRQFPGRSARFIGYAPGTAAYLLWDGGKQQTIVSRDVTFSEDTFNLTYQDFDVESDGEQAFIEIVDDKVRHVPEELDVSTISDSNLFSSALENPSGSESPEETIPSVSTEQPESGLLSSNLGSAWDIDPNSTRAQRLEARGPRFMRATTQKC